MLEVVDDARSQNGSDSSIAAKTPRAGLLFPGMLRGENQRRISNAVQHQGNDLLSNRTSAQSRRKRRQLIILADQINELVE
jgi:hypothetical protein